MKYIDPALNFTFKSSPKSHQIPLCRTTKIVNRPQSITYISRFLKMDKKILILVTIYTKRYQLLSDISSHCRPNQYRPVTQCITIQSSVQYTWCVYDHQQNITIPLLIQCSFRFSPPIQNIWAKLFKYFRRFPGDHKNLA